MSRLLQLVACRESFEEYGPVTSVNSRRGGIDLPGLLSLRYLCNPLGTMRITSLEDKMGWRACAN